jgi:hypothetical protein
MSLPNIDQITQAVADKIQTEVIDKFVDKLDATSAYMLSTIWKDVVDIVLCILLIDIYWCCFCLIMHRDRVYIPPFGDAKPMDNLFFLFSFYFIFKLIRVNNGLF